MSEDVKIDVNTTGQLAGEETASPGADGSDKKVEEQKSGSQADQAMPQLSEGIGMNYEEVRQMLTNKHGIILGRDEPIMMMVTLCNVFLSELEKVHNKHNEAVTKIMVDQTDKYIKGVKATTDALGRTLAENSVEAIRSIFQTHADALTSNKINARWCAAVIGASALANIAVMAFSVWR